VKAHVATQDLEKARCKAIILEIERWLDLGFGALIRSSWIESLLCKSTANCFRKAV